MRGAVCQEKAMSGCGAAGGLLLQALGMAMLAGGGSLCARVLASLTAAAAQAGNLPLAARALGALDAVSEPREGAGTAGAGPAIAPDLASTLQATACAAYVEEGRAGGISMIITLYRGDQQSAADLTRLG
jgi:hypothetical protein